MEDLKSAMVPLAFGLTMFGLFLGLGLVFNGIQIKYGIRTAACINLQMSAQQCSDWEHEWQALN
jgi:hypothetical protein